MFEKWLQLATTVSVIIALTCSSCTKPETQDPIVKPPTPVEEGNKVEQVYSNLCVNLSTDKVAYCPGEEVRITADNLPEGVKARYRHLGSVVEEFTPSSSSWVWMPPKDDFKGYLLELYQSTDKGTCILGTIAIDVSSDWKRFPRYGFVASFGKDKTAEQTDMEMEELSRYHINGVQFQDWHYKHHWPFPGTPEQPLEVYKDIANRNNYLSAVKSYIAAQHKRGMKSIFYNLCFGVLDDAQEDGVDPSWYLQKANGTYDTHDLHSTWKSDIFLVDPGNKDWQEYSIARIEEVYRGLDFDGFQIDQLGNRGALFTMGGTQIDLPKAYASYIKAIAGHFKNKDHIFNSVDNYALKEIASTNMTSFAYNELWAGNDQFSSLLSTVVKNDDACPGLQTCFAAYMNYGLSHKFGYFNDAGVLLSNAMMHAIGASHLELGGDHMLGNEYFPNKNLTMKESLKTAMIRYYDFITAYENLLRGSDGQIVEAKISSSKLKLKPWTLSSTPDKGRVMSFSRKYADCQVVHFLNLLRADSTSWRDMQGTMPSPSIITDAALEIEYNDKATKVWAASPDLHSGAVQELSFTQKNGKISCKLPSLRYWTMIVIE